MVHAMLWGIYIFWTGLVIWKEWSIVHQEAWILSSCSCVMSNNSLSSLGLSHIQGQVTSKIHSSADTQYRFLAWKPSIFLKKYIF